MIRDALDGTHWNTVHWAFANLHHVTEGKHEVFRGIASVTEAKMQGQKFLQNAVRALEQNDMQTLGRFVTAPSELFILAVSDRRYPMLSRLWNAAASAEAALG
jgi:hypothetical protein